jgi:hypothetical protein
MTGRGISLDPARFMETLTPVVEGQPLGFVTERTTRQC